jgi:hypothetical protein
VFRVVETRPGWVPSIRRGRGVHTTGPGSPIVPRRFPATSPLRRSRDPSPAVWVTTHTKIHFHLPVRSFPARNSRMDRESLGISVGFTPSSYPDRMPRREERLDTRPATVSTPPILHPLQPLAPRDITSHSRPLPDTSACAFSQLAHHDRLQLTQQWVVWNRPPQGGSRGPTSIVRTAPGHEALPTSSSLPVRDTRTRMKIKSLRLALERRQPGVPNRDGLQRQS